MIREILREGLRLVSKNWKYIFLLWGSNVVLALVLTIPIFSLLLDNLAHSIWSDSLALNLDYIWLIQFQKANQNLLDKMPLLFFSIVGINILSQKFYQGGLIGVFNNPKKNHISDFFYSGVKYWFRFIKVSAISIILLIAIYFIDSFIGEWISYLYNDLYSVVIDLLFRSVNYLILLFVIGAIAIVTEYTQIYLALNNSNKIWQGFRFTLKFIKEKFFIVFITFLIVSIIGAVGAVVYNVVSIFIPRSPFYFLILTFILQQMLIIFRLSITMLLYATEVYLFKDQNAEIISK
jgi:hypothetical protein